VHRIPRHPGLCPDIRLPRLDIVELLPSRDVAGGGEEEAVRLLGFGEGCDEAFRYGQEFLVVADAVGLRDRGQVVADEVPGDERGFPAAVGSRPCRDAGGPSESRSQAIDIEAF